jgi:hypothetical protein
MTQHHHLQHRLYLYRYLDFLLRQHHRHHRQNFVQQRLQQLRRQRNLDWLFQHLQNLAFL